jgi:F-type H+-transporting ATPase subunit epsilon
MATQDEAHRPDRIALEVVTPKGTALKAEADEVAAPSVHGEFGVLPGHLPILAALHTGLVSYRLGTETKKCAVGHGFVEAGPEKVVILTDRCVTRDQIDPIVVRKELGETQQKISELQATTSDLAGDPTKVSLELDALVREENWLAAQLDLYGDPPLPTMQPLEATGQAPVPDGQEASADTTEPTSAADNAQLNP